MLQNIQVADSGGNRHPLCSELHVNGLVRVSVLGVKSLGGHFACLCWGFDFYEVKEKEKKFKK